jgi:hypothetical protein
MISFPQSELASSPWFQGSKIVTFRVFYCFYAENDVVLAADAAPMDVADIYSELLGRLSSDGDFLGMTDEEGHTLQMMYDPDKDRYCVEIPSPERHGSYACNMDFDQVVELMKALPTQFVPAAIPGLEFETWLVVECATVRGRRWLPVKRQSLIAHPSSLPITGNW